MKCRKCGFEDKHLDRRKIRTSLIDALRRAEELTREEKDQRDGNAIARGCLQGAIEIAVDNLDRLCFTCGHTTRRLAEQAAAKAVKP